VAALDALTEEYLAFARFPRAQFEEDSLNEMVVTLADFVRPLATRQHIALDVTTDRAIPPMEIDRTLLRQAVLNLIKNGIEVLPQGGTVSVTTRRLDDTVEIAVRDTAPAFRPRSDGGCSSSFSRPSRRAPVSDCPSPARSWKSTGGRSAGRAHPTRGRPSRSRCR